jgi:hypothetical protein
MNWQGAGDASYTDTSDANLSFGGVTVEGNMTEGSLTKQADGKIKIEGTVEFGLPNENYDFREEGIANHIPKPQGFAVGDWLTPAELKVLEGAGGAKPFPVKSGKWKRHILGTVVYENGKMVARKIDWKEIP